MLRLNNQRPEIRAEIRYQYMIIPNAGSVTALPVFLGKLVVVRISLHPFLFISWSFSPDPDRIPLDAVMKTQRDLQRIHHILNGLILEIAGEPVLQVVTILKAEPDIVPSFQLRSYIRKSFVPENKLVFNPGSLDEGAVNGI